MSTFGEIADFLDTLAPESTAEEWDNVGLLLGSRSTEVRGILVALDVTADVISEAEKLGANLILTHHPVIFQPLHAISDEERVAQLIRRGIGVLSAHTNLDRAPNGVNETLCRMLELGDITPFAEGLGRMAMLPRPMTAAQLADFAKERLSAQAVDYLPTDGPLRQAAVVSGAGGEFWAAARESGADVLITGEVRHHEWIDAANAGFPIVCAGHHATEAVVLEPLAERLRAAFPAVPVSVLDRWAVQRM